MNGGLLNAKIFYAMDMSKHEVNIYIEPKLKVSVKKAWFKTQMKRILDILNLNMPSELGLVITNDEMMRMLNKRYRHKDVSTDVLSFPMDLKQGKKISKILRAIPPDGVSHLGEIIISYPEAIVQARNKEHDTRSELLILMIHGVLHLLGYDHEQSKEKEQHMRTREKEILKKLTL